MRRSTSFSSGPLSVSVITRAPEVDGHVKIMAGIGHVCVQWSRLEMLILGVISSIETMPTEKVEIIFGGLDIIPRVTMAINLARHAKMSQPIISRIEKVRSRLQGGVADKRNQVVHGAHRDWEGDEVTLTMVRWKGDRRSQRLSIKEIHALGVEIHDLGQECWSLMEVIHKWHLRRIDHRHKQALSQIGQ